MKTIFSLITILFISGCAFDNGKNMETWVSELKIAEQDYSSHRITTEEFFDIFILYLHSYRENADINEIIEAARNNKDLYARIIAIKEDNITLFNKKLRKWKSNPELKLNTLFHFWCSRRIRYW